MSTRELDLKTHTHGWCVSTVKLAVAHGWGPDHAEEFWYETYIFPSDGEKVTDWLEVWGDRYRTEHDARRGHARVVAKVEAGELPEAVA